MRHCFNASGYGIPENGLGVAVTNEHGDFFCGYAQADGSLAFRYMAQTPHPFQQPTITPVKNPEAISKQKPVFLSPEMMKQHGVGAVAYRSFDGGLRKNLAKAARPMVLKSVSVFKDLTNDKTKPASGHAFETAGFASADACKAGRTIGYVEISTALKQKLGHWLGRGSASSLSSPKR